MMYSEYFRCVYGLPPYYVQLQWLIRYPYQTWTYKTFSLYYSFSSLSDDRSKASSKTIPPHSAIQSLLLQMRVSSPVLKVIQ